ncbi:YCII-related domain-containing protein [Mucilaginibacter gossypiicola]|uniref:YCII-related domain-containing protein n=1 Tax=Mucilaginibacter gossypiicola TaxID=551995 RepID=A0A1H8HI31_9SPHI|nr:YciI family protein [Mucilaginibacter gossypiicola]SEN55746.1 YCII-related domain-containing protein [Mucilaginibacter gossypiicola]
MVHASAYKDPHHVMLFFGEIGNPADNQQCLADRRGYYDNLKSNGKVVISGDFWNQDKNFVIVSVSNDNELVQIIENDPAIKQNVLELIKAMPF